MEKYNGKYSLKKALSEAIITVGQKQYRVSDKEIGLFTKAIDATISKAAKAGTFTAKEYKPVENLRKNLTKKGKLKPVSKKRDGLKSVSFKDEDYWEELQQGLESAGMSISNGQKLYYKLMNIATGNVATKYFDNVIDRLLQEDPKKLVKDLFSIETPPQNGFLNIPKSLQGVAKIDTISGEGTSGTSIGRGELAIPLMFTDAEGQYGQAAHDVVINGNGWHVKAVASDNAHVRTGVNTFGLSEKIREAIGTRLHSGEVSPASTALPAAAKIADIVLAEEPALHKKFIGNTDISTPAGVKRALEMFQFIVDRDLRDSWSDAQGVIFCYDDGRMKFVPTAEINVKQITSGAFNITPGVGGYQKVANEQGK